MRFITVDELKDAVFKLAKERGMLPYGVGRKQFYANTTKYVKLPEYCRLVIAALRQKGADVEYIRAKLMMVGINAANFMRRSNGKRYNKKR